MTGAPPATLERIGSVALITLNRPHRLNAVDESLATALGEALAELDDDPVLQVGVLTGAGDAFCAGADLKALRDGGSLRSRRHPEWGFAGLVERSTESPLVAAVNGVALGGGAEIAMACDVIVMADSATIGLPEVRRGLFAGAGGLIRLPRQLPPRIAREMALTGDPMSAPAALGWGLVNRVVPRQAVVEEAVTLAARIARNAPLAVRASKRLLALADAGLPARELWAEQDRLVAELLVSDDAREGVRAFTEKRAPVWSHH